MKAAGYRHTDERKKRGKTERRNPDGVLVFRSYTAQHSHTQPRNRGNDGDHPDGVEE
jgi:hypothetical protein